MTSMVQLFLTTGLLIACTNARNIIKEQDESEAATINEEIVAPRYFSCAHLNPANHSQPHENTDLSCEQGLPGWKSDQGCSCDYLVAERDSQGCAKSYYTLCIREKSANDATSIHRA